MTADHTDTEERWLARELEIIALQIGDLKEEMLRLQARARDGDISAVKEAQKTVLDVRQFLNRAAETEEKLAEIRHGKPGGDGGQFALDLDGARASIRCRLDRLRRCCGAG
ncbi:hypothetical protein [Pseudooceanicola sp. LIPI14-2-Ac024]|uniref:hypothetical protein n=1 Tax=Pseudooceanicola sp. LIPI14-2-Ac024 TaxID=3344875 RepID=UPI0035CFDD56